MIDSSQRFDLPTVLSLSDEPHPDSRSPNHRRSAGQSNLARPPVHTGVHAMRRNNIDLYWAKIDTASEGAIAQVRVTDDGSGSDFLLPFPCKLTKEGWVNAVSGSRLAVRPIYWKPYVATTSKAPMESDAESPACVLMTDCLPPEHRRFEKSRKNGESCYEAGRPL